MSNIIENMSYIICVILVGQMYIGFEVVKSRKRRVLATVISVIFVILSSLFGSDITKYPLFFVFINIIVKILFDIKTKTMLIFSFLFVNFHALIYLGASMLVEAISRFGDIQLNNWDWVALICNIGICVFLFIFGLLAKKFTLLGTGKIKKNRMILIFIILGFDIIILISVGLNIVDADTGLFTIKTSLLYILITVEILIQFIVIVYLATARDTIKEREELVEMYLRAQVQHYDDLSRKERETRKFRHDIMNHLELMAQMCEEKDIEGVENYLSQLNAHIDNIKSGISTHNHIADAIFDRYHHNCAEVGIMLDVQGHFPSDCSISELDLCTILSNLLDNAVRAEVEAEGALISVKIRYTDDEKILIIVENDFKEEPKSRNGIFITTKKNKNDHGFGLENIKDCVERNNGITNITTENNKFKVWICLDNSKSKDSSC